MLLPLWSWFLSLSLLGFLRRLFAFQDLPQLLEQGAPRERLLEEHRRFAPGCTYFWFHARHVEHFQLWALRTHLPDRFVPAHARHIDVGQHQVYFSEVYARGRDRFRPAAGLDHLVAALRQDPLGRLADGLVVFHQQDGLPDWGQRVPGCRSFTMRGRHLLQEHSESRALA